MYVAVKGGEKAIDAAHRQLARARRGDPAVPELALAQIDQQLSLAVDRVMAEAALYDRGLAALAIKQARGDLVEAVFLLRAFRTTLPRFTGSLPLDTGKMAPRRRISATFKDVPGGQILGATFDYTHRLLDFALAEPGSAGSAGSGSAASARGAKETATAGSEARGRDQETSAASARGANETGSEARGRDQETSEASARGANLEACPPAAEAEPLPAPRILELLDREGLIEPPPAETGGEPPDLTRDPMALPAERALRLQNLARGDEGFLLSLGYSAQRGYGYIHPFAGEIRIGETDIEILPEELGFAIVIGEITLAECEMVTQFTGSAEEAPRFTRGYGLVFGESERKAMAMALVDRALRAKELGEEVRAPAQDEEFVLLHADNVEASGFVQHLKLPHHVDFQSELDVLRRIRAAGRAGSGSEASARGAKDAGSGSEASARGAKDAGSGSAASARGAKDAGSGSAASARGAKKEQAAE
jgi:alpha-D-ribose 1-methylphosphonate 5-triphosphate synthase subunit PhnI